ncbi:hypothetical protein [Anthocerotibacter panamensis]|uniref:hypothetical protein n=1 Tax=Anthocerotibacter panamensis TaxID=2857077 RepID=UPI001C40287E|nr:hypothetical protein [Anthocerotibacter panamensis]
MPTVPTLPAIADTQGLAQLEQQIGLYERLNKIAMDRATQLFQTYVSASLLPIFTAILGYIFGARKE